MNNGDKTAKDNSEQSAKFIEAAKEHECDASDKEFRDKLKKIAKQEKPAK